ncbi:MAG: efflux RND transporter periplasmic adaptor subunit [Terriglobia bacterium]
MIDKSENRFRALRLWTVGGIVLLGCVAALIPACATKAGGKEEKQKPAFMPPVVIVAPVVEKTVPIYEEYVGQTNSVNTVEIRSQVQGYLERMAFVEGSTVQKGQLLFLIDPREYQAAGAKARAAVDQSRAALAKSRRDVARYAPLVKQHAVSQEQLDTSVAEEEEGQANVESAKAQLAQAQLNLGYTQIRAPLTGRIGQAQMKVGALVQAGSSLLTTIYSVNPMYVNFSVSEATYLEFEKRSGSRLLRSFPPLDIILGDNSIYRYKGHIDMVSPQVDPATGTLGMRVEAPNPAGFLRSGLFVRVRLMVHQQPDAKLVPTEAVQEVQGVQSVLVVSAQNKVQFRTVTAGSTVDNMRIIESGLKPGERVIVQGGQKVRPGLTVTPEER